MPSLCCPVECVCMTELSRAHASYIPCQQTEVPDGSRTSVLICLFPLFDKTSVLDRSKAFPLIFDFWYIGFFSMRHKKKVIPPRSSGTLDPLQARASSVRALKMTARHVYAVPSPMPGFELACNGCAIHPSSTSVHLCRHYAAAYQGQKSGL